jgi:hypothetical protein
VSLHYRLSTAELLNCEIIGVVICFLLMPSCNVQEPKYVCQAKLIAKQLAYTMVDRESPMVRNSFEKFKPTANNHNMIGQRISSNGY